MEKFGNCPKCGSELQGPFCSQCGRPARSRAIQFGSFFNVVFEYLTNWERKLFTTIKELFRRPGLVIQSFIEKDREQFYHPIKFLLFWASINFLISQWLGVSAFSPNEGQNEFEQRISKIFEEYGSFLWILCLPFTALGNYLIWRSKDPKFVHHSIFAAYLIGMNLLISIPLFFLKRYIPDPIWLQKTLPPLLTLCMCTYFAYNWSKRNWLFALLTGVLIFFFTFLGMFFYFMLAYILVSLSI